MIPEQHVNVVVVGGGAAGLAAAATAEEAGLSCQLFEAQGRLGGRVRTVPLQSGGVFDQGAQMVNGDMHAVLALAERAGLHVSPVPRAGIDLRVVDGESYRGEELISFDEVYELLEDQVIRWDSLGEAFRALCLKMRWWNTPWESMGEAGRGVRLLVEKRSVPKDSLAAALRGILLGKEEHALAYSHFSEIYGGPPEDIDAHAVREQFSRYESERDDLEFQFPDGMMVIIDELASGLRHTPFLETPVTSIRTVPDRVEVTAKEGVWQADHVIVAVPPPIARKIDFDIEGRDELADLLSSFTAGDLIKTVLVYENAFRRLKGFSGSVVFAEPEGLAVVDASHDGGHFPRLVAFHGGPSAREWAQLARDVRQSRLLSCLSEVFGEEARAPIEQGEAVWVDHPWAGGGYNSTVRIGGHRDAVSRLAAWGDRVRFAGAEVDDRFWGYVEGAIHSGRTAIQKILKGGTPTAVSVYSADG
ncbi:MAG: NAD(P)/FAD-dependent oxidoreductase [Planctomycetota bacterium]